MQTALTDTRFGPAPRLPDIPDKIWNIVDHGAVAGGGVLNTDAISSAIAAASAAGGGRVVVPDGIWLTGPVHFRSRIELHLEPGAELRFSQNPDDYLPVVFMQRGGIRCFNYSPFLYARGCHDIALTGKGLLNGQGQSWWPWKKAQPGMRHLTESALKGEPPEQRQYGTKEAGVRPPFVHFIESERVLIEGLTLIDSPSWTVHPVWCEDLTIRHLTVRNPTHGANTDGINVDSCHRALVEHCLVDTGDDAICVKSGREKDAWQVGRPCEEVTVRHCRILAGHGGFVIGSETAASIRHIHVHDCVFEGTKRGLRLKTRPGRGGEIAHVLWERIHMSNIREEAIVMTLRYGDLTVGEEDSGNLSDVPSIRNITLRDVECESAGTALVIEGLPGHPLRNLRLERIKVTAAEPMRIDGVEHLRMDEVCIRKQPGPTS